MKIYDICTFNGEKELFDIRYNILKDHVDEFRVIEFGQTFSGKNKGTLHPLEGDKIKYEVVGSEIWSKYEEQARSSPNTEYGKGAQHWVREFCQKESIKDCLSDLNDDDVVFIGDVDEIWDPILSLYEPKQSHKLGLRVYSYYLDNRSSEQFYGTLWTKYGLIKDKCLNHVRSLPNYHKYVPRAGWHFTSIGGYEKVKQKLTDSYTEDSYANPAVLANLDSNINNLHDFLGRDFTYSRDTSEWPKYLHDNKERYKHLLTPE